MAESSSVLVAAFVQVNTIRGYRYLDDAGQIINTLESEFPEVQVGLDGMKMINPAAALRELSVNVQRIWIRFDEPESTQEITKQSRRIIETVCRIIGVDSFSRAALRLQHVVSIENNPDFVYEVYKNVFKGRVAALLAQTSQNDEHGFEIALPLTSGGLRINQQISPVQRTPVASPGRALAVVEEVPETEELPRFGLMFDSDIYVSSGTRLQRLGNFLREAEDWVRGSLPEVISILTEEVRP